MDRLHLLLIGDPGRLAEVVAAVGSLGHRVTLVAARGGPPFQLLPQDAGAPSETAVDGHDAILALTEGASEGPPAGSPVRVTTGIRREGSLMNGHRLADGDEREVRALPLWTRDCGEGERIVVEHGRVAEIVEGTVAVSAVHPDGAEMLIGILPPGDFIIPHPPDSCHTELVAHTEVRLAYWTWAQAVTQPGFGASLFSRVLRDEAWAASQAHPSFEQRLLGILRLLAEWFGKREGSRTLIDLRLTHGHLAAITRTTRPTVTRVLSALTASGQVGATGHGSRRRFWIADMVDENRLLTDD